MYGYMDIRRDCWQNRPSAVPIENHSVESRQSKDREPVEIDLSRPTRYDNEIDSCYAIFCFLSKMYRRTKSF